MRQRVRRFRGRLRKRAVLAVINSVKTVNQDRVLGCKPGTLFIADLSFKVRRNGKACCELTVKERKSWKLYNRFDIYASKPFGQFLDAFREVRQRA